MWTNRITLDDFVYHYDARVEIKRQLSLLKKDGNDIHQLLIKADDGYVMYLVTLRDGNEIGVFDSGNKFEIIKDAEQPKTSFQEDVSPLEYKISKAKMLGLKFKLVPVGSGMSGAAYDEMEVIQTWTDKKFEEVLDEKIKGLEASTYLQILRKYKMI